MYCRYCGLELPKGSIFCPNCAKDVEEGSLNQVMNKDDMVNYANYVGKNYTYFSQEFSNVAAGQTVRFNWAAFWLGIFYCVYRKQYNILWEYFKVPLSLFFTSSLVIPILLMDINISDVELDTAYPVWGMAVLVGLLWLLGAQVLLGKNFNRLYYESLKNPTVEKKGLKKQGGTSVKSVIVFFLLYGMVLSLPMVVAVRVIRIHGMEKLYEDRCLVEAIDAIEGYYIFDDKDAGIAIDRNFLLSYFGEGKELFSVEMSVIDRGDNYKDYMDLVGSIGEEYWDEAGISSEEGATVKMRFVFQDGRVTNIYAGGKEISARKVPEQEFYSSFW